MLFGAYEIKNEIIVEGSMFADYFYMMIFTDYLVPWWLGLFALVLALISVCPVFPDFLKTGSIDVAISKPMSRATLFFVKYLGSLFFVAIQVLVFCVIVFVAHGMRLGSWSFDIFSAFMPLSDRNWHVPSVAFMVNPILSNRCAASTTPALSRLDTEINTAPSRGSFSLVASWAL